MVQRLTSTRQQVEPSKTLHLPSIDTNPHSYPKGNNAVFERLAKSRTVADLSRERETTQQSYPKGNNSVFERLTSNNTATEVSDKEKGRMPGQNRSYTSNEVQKVVDRLSTYNRSRWPPGSKDDVTYISPALEVSKVAVPKHAILSKEAGTVVDRLSRYDPEVGPPESPYAKRSRTRKVSEEDQDVDIDKMIGRLSNYDKSRYPPESKGTMVSMIPDIIQPRWNKECQSGTDEEIQKIVERLSKYDPTKGPPDSPYKK